MTGTRNEKSWLLRLFQAHQLLRLRPVRKECESSVASKIYIPSRLSSLVLWSRGSSCSSEAGIVATFFRLPLGCFIGSTRIIFYTPAKAMLQRIIDPAVWSVAIAATFWRRRRGETLAIIRPNREWKTPSLLKGTSKKNEFNLLSYIVTRCIRVGKKNHPFNLDKSLLKAKSLFLNFSHFSPG